MTATVPVGAGPYGVAVPPDGDRVYISNPGSDTVSVLDTVTNTVTATIPVNAGSTGTCLGNTPCNGVAVTPDGRKVYVGNRGLNSVSVINTATNTVIATVPVGAFPLWHSGDPGRQTGLCCNHNKTRRVSATDLSP